MGCMRAMLAFVPTMQLIGLSFGGCGKEPSQCVTGLLESLQARVTRDGVGARACRPETRFRHLSRADVERVRKEGRSLECMSHPHAIGDDDTALPGMAMVRHLIVRSSWPCCCQVVKPLQNEHA